MSLSSHVWIPEITITIKIQNCSNTTKHKKATP